MKKRIFIAIIVMLISLSLGSFIKVNGHSAYNNLLEDQKELESEKEDIHISEPNEIIPLAAYKIYILKMDGNLIIQREMHLV